MGSVWPSDSLKVKVKAPSGTGDISFQFESGADGKVIYSFTPTADNQWHDYAFPLRDFVPVSGATNFDSTAVNVFQFISDNGQAGREIYMDDLWTGNPVIDVVSPPPPANVFVSTGSFVNTVLWDDSTHPITDIKVPDVEEVISGTPSILENTSILDHLLFAPAITQSTSYYYAMTCTDAAGNTSVTSQNSPLTTNDAKGVSPINPTAPTNFAADGDLSEWASITPFRMFPSDGSGHVVTNTTVDGDADLSVLAYVAMDNDYLYVAFDVVDDTVSTDTTQTSYLIFDQILEYSFDVVDDTVSTDTTQTSYLIDSPDLFIGLYNWHGAPHSSYKRGTEPDYHFRFGRNAVILDNLGSARLLNQGDPNYYWDERFSPGYVVEAKIALADIAAAGGDNLFNPLLGMRIPIDFSVNDNDQPGTNLREGIMTYSPFNEDHSYEHPYRWLYTWIGDQWTGVDDNNYPVNRYELYQNYPNPFNPSTSIKYTLEKQGMVTIKIFDILGREVATLINEEQSAGNHTLRFDAKNLSSGAYFYRIESGSFIQVNKMMLLK